MWRRYARCPAPCRNWPLPRCKGLLLRVWNLQPPGPTSGGLRCLVALHRHTARSRLPCASVSRDRWFAGFYRSWYTARALCICLGICSVMHRFAGGPLALLIGRARRRLGSTLRRAGENAFVNTRIYAPLAAIAPEAIPLQEIWRILRGAYAGRGNPSRRGILVSGWHRPAGIVRSASICHDIPRPVHWSPAALRTDADL